MKYRNHNSRTVLLSPQYAEHVQAMTAENLYGKAEIAEELASRDLELARLRHHLTELGKAADAAAMVIATIEAEDTTEEEKLQAVMDAIGTWAPDAIMGSNARNEASAAPLAAGRLD